jgi:hypothetical protein
VSEPIQDPEPPPHGEPLTGPEPASRPEAPPWFGDSTPEPDTQPTDPVGLSAFDAAVEPGEPAPLARRDDDLLPQLRNALANLDRAGQASGPLGSGTPGPGRGDPLPHRGDPLPRRDPATARDGDPLPRPDGPLPKRGQVTAQPAASPLPKAGDATAQPAASPLPKRGDATALLGDALPRRTTRTRPPGRHRSPHRLTVPSDAPALVLAIPGAPVPATVALAEEIAATAQLSCPGVDVRIGYLAGDELPLADVLRFPADGSGEFELRAVIVPVLAGPHPVLDAMLADVAGRTAAPVMIGAHLGPHPLLAEALHARLADAGLARAGRARGLSIVTGINGVLVLADRGPEAIQAAGVSTVLLAARLAVPATPASLGDPGSVTAGLARLREAGASHLAISPCLIGPESPPHEIEAVQAVLNAPSAPPIGAHPAVGKLVAMRYGAALARVAMASSAG